MRRVYTTKRILTAETLRRGEKQKAKSEDAEVAEDAEGKNLRVSMRRGHSCLLGRDSDLLKSSPQFRG
jgi:hypothetical protein